MVSLSVTKRNPKEASPKALRRENKIVGVVYGAHRESTPIAIDRLAFDKVLREAGEASIVSLTGIGEAVPTLIHEVDLDPLTSRPRHVDFYAVTKGKKVEVNIPLEFIGESPAVKAGANLVRVLHEVEVEADPMNLPHSISVDISVLAAVGDQIHAKDLVLPASVTLITEPGEVLVLIQEIVEEKIEVPVAADISSIEVEKKGKEEEEAAETVEPAS